MVHLFIRSVVISEKVYRYGYGVGVGLVFSSTPCDLRNTRLSRLHDQDFKGLFDKRRTKVP